MEQQENTFEATYQQQGFRSPIDLLTAEEAREHRDALEALEREFEGHLDSPVRDYLRMAAHLATDLPLKIATDDRLLDHVEQVLGPDIMLWSCEYFIKEAHSVGIVSWHQDLTYWGMGESDHEVSAWIAISPATRDSGCMQFVPGSHHQQIVPHRDTFAENNLLSRGQEISVDVDEDDAFLVELEPGQMSLHHGRLFHSSGPNSTNDRRIGLVLRFIRPDTPSTGTNADYAVLVRGVDRAGIRRNMAPGTGNFTPDQLRLREEVNSSQMDVLADGLDADTPLYETKT